jgi:hypothetical protein
MRHREGSKFQVSSRWRIIFQNSCQTAYGGLVGVSSRPAQHTSELGTRECRCHRRRSRVYQGRRRSEQILRAGGRPCFRIGGRVSCVLVVMDYYPGHVTREMCAFVTNFSSREVADARASHLLPNSVIVLLWCVDYSLHSFHVLSSSRIIQKLKTRTQNDTRHKTVAVHTGTN